MTPSRPVAVEAGSAGLLTVWVGAVVVATAVAAVVWGSAVVARHRAGRTADLAALAAAAAVQSGAPDPCQAARRVAETAHTGIESCAVVADRSVLVVVRLPPAAPGPWRLVLPPARARARAGADTSG